MATIVNNYANTGGNWQDVHYLAKRARRLIFVPKWGNDQTENTIASVSGVTKSALQALFDDHQVKDRYYPLPNLDNVENPGREESTFFEWNSGQETFVKDGKKSFKAMIKVEDGGPALVKKLKEWRGAKFGCYIIDTDKNFHYYLDEAGTIVKPMPIDGDRFDVRWIEPTDEGPGMIEISFNFADEMEDGNLRYIDYNGGSGLDFDGTDYDDVYALWDVSLTEVSNSLTTITVNVKTDYDIPVTGLALADFYLYNTTDSAEITITNLAESTTTSGQYVLTFASQDASDAYTLRINKSKYDYADTVSGTLTA